jgi:hypothetical protein
MSELSAVSIVVARRRLPFSSYVKTRSSSEFRCPAKKSPALVET